MPKTIQIRTAVVVLALACILSVTYLSKASPAIGSVARGNDYQATSTHKMTGGVAVVAPIQRQIQTGDTVLGSIVVSSSTPVGGVKFWNATSTTDTASTSVIVTGNNLLPDELTYDMVFPRGLIVELPAGFFGDYTITYR